MKGSEHQVIDDIEYSWHMNLLEGKHPYSEVPFVDLLDDYIEQLYDEVKGDERKEYFIDKSKYLLTLLDLYGFLDSTDVAEREHALYGDLLRIEVEAKADALRDLGRYLAGRVDFIFGESNAYISSDNVGDEDTDGYESKRKV